MSDTEPREEQSRGSLQQQREAVPNLTIRDMVSLASRQLHGNSHPLDNGYAIDVRDYPANRMVSLELSKSQLPNGGTNLRIVTYRLKEQDPTSTINLTNIEHLYVTWQTKGMISFCYAGDGRYKLINVTYENGVVLVEDVDRRRPPRPESEMSESEKLARAQRRTFYHIGRTFDKVEAHDPSKPMEGSVEAEEARVMGGGGEE